MPFRSRDRRKVGRRGHRVDDPAVDELVVPDQRLGDEEDDDRRREGTEPRQCGEQAPVAERPDQEAGRRRADRRAENQA